VHTRPLRIPINGKIFYLAHGDGLADPSRSFRFIRSVFHSRTCQFLFARFPSRWGIGFGHWWSRHNRKKDLACSAAYKGEENEYLALFAKKQIQEDPNIDYFIFGHRHILLDWAINGKTRMIIVGDWMQHFSYAVFDGKELILKQYKADI
jgi:UDP-2,3-diacylglucosamine hydrolase